MGTLFSLKHSVLLVTVSPPCSHAAFYHLVSPVMKEVVGLIAGLCRVTPQAKSSAIDSS